MPKLILMRGLSGSGKTTLAKEWLSEDPDNRARVNRDDLRESIFNQEGVLSNDKESLITKIQREVATDALKAGKDVINDDTNLRRKFAVEWATLAKSLGADFEVRDVDTSLDCCLRRNHARMLVGGRYVPEDAIKSQARRFPYPWPTVEAKDTSLKIEPYTNSHNGFPTYLVDIDGTVATFGNRGPFDWDKVDGDDPRLDVIHTVQALAKVADIVFLSGRDGSCYDKTLWWLQEHINLNRQIELYMRPAGDNRPDYVVKYELFNAHARLRNIIAVFDDRVQCLRLWSQLGLTTFDVGRSFLGEVF